MKTLSKENLIAFDRLHYYIEELIGSLSTQTKVRDKF
jgi:hypothetical protein